MSVPPPWNCYWFPAELLVFSLVTGSQLNYWFYLSNSATGNQAPPPAEPGVRGRGLAEPRVDPSSTWTRTSCRTSSVAFRSRTWTPRRSPAGWREGSGSERCRLCLGFRLQCWLQRFPSDPVLQVRLGAGTALRTNLNGTRPSLCGQDWVTMTTGSEARFWGQRRTWSWPD